MFILNPTAGMPGAAAKAEELIRTRCAAAGLDYQLIHTEAKGHAAKLVLEKAHKEHEWLVYACGGDGTLNEVVSGAVYRPNVTVAHIPFGTGNDFIRNFPVTEPFFQMEVLQGYDLLTTDVIKAGNRICLNCCAMGFDARAAQEMENFRKLKRIHPKIPYNLGVLTALFKGTGRHYNVRVGDEVFDGSYTLVTVMNGRYYGGGFNPAPSAMPDDGLLDVIIVKARNAVQIMSVIKFYARGEMEKLADIAYIRRAREIHIATPKPVSITYDGEMDEIRETHVQILPGKLKFAVPKGITWAKPKKNLAF